MDTVTVNNDHFLTVVAGDEYDFSGVTGFAALDFYYFDGVQAWIDLDSDAADTGSRTERNFVDDDGTPLATITGLSTSLGQEGFLKF